ncbi:unnamed protein product [Clonostachys rosea f. rosea IK726]|uniref:Protein YTP1-like C-terminal domain-containing protein n=2 Tax=Bionectria ochroleuca TaxID=29856 RepID=A0A0B7K0T8_BIOOC|nr:unnamed protein product [Clonostachys rosea f. rosea IK726]
MMRAPLVSRTALVLAVAAALPLVLAHGGDGGHGMHGNGSMEADMPKDESEYPPTYFAHPEHRGLIVGHIALMTIGWVLILPVGAAVMFSLVSSRYTIYTQFVFLATNAVGVLLSTIYNASTPDLYPGNAHHSIGWIITWVVSAQVLIGLVGRIARVVRGSQHGGDSEAHKHTFLPVSEEDYREFRHSNDSGQGTEPGTESLRSNSVSTVHGDHDLDSPHKEYEEDADFEEMPLTSPAAPKATKFGKLAKLVASTRIWTYFELVYKIIDRIILPFGFIAFATGMIAYARFFEGHGVYSGLAHWIKGGIFFWLGLFTLGRWSGAFAEVGWAWNIRPKPQHQRWRPTAEFTESFLIFFYGSTNIFMEHLGGAGGAWSAQDLEHLAITVLFIGGGLCGMLIESAWIRNLLNTSMIEVEPMPLSDEEREQSFEPATYKFSLNPIPALVIMLLGIMMSSHQQPSMLSSMVHKQWGDLLFGASLARGLTYILIYLRPPTSIYPSRPPTELLAAFGLMAGGIIFMASSSDTVTGMIHYKMEEMFMYTVTMGLVGVLMAWEIFVLALKGWAQRKERRSTFH